MKGQEVCYNASLGVEEATSPIYSQEGQYPVVWVAATVIIRGLSSK